MNKHGKVNWTAIGVIAGILVLAVILVGGFSGWFSGHAQVVLNPKDNDNTGNNANGNGVTVYGSTPSVSYGGVDYFQPSSTVGSSQTVFVNGVVQASAPSTASVGDKFTVLFTNSSLHNAVVKDYAIKGGANAISGQLKGNASLTMQFRNTNGAVMTSGGTGTNQSSSSVNGEGLDVEVRMNGQSLKSTNDLLCVLEVNSSTKYDTAVGKTELTIKDATRSNKKQPKVYSALAGSSILTYTMTPFEDTKVNIGNLHLQASTGQTLAGTKFIVTCYSYENFVDPLNGLTYDVEDSSGNLKSIATYTFTGFVN